ncbi:MAG: lipopolysaccharide heptosyltransferase II [Planctomycetota bacterium]|nr:MAG: lipopolysaccharide heptosyltransferase II [Planctomycetota bacterium]
MCSTARCSGTTHSAGVRTPGRISIRWTGWSARSIESPATSSGARGGSPNRAPRWLASSTALTTRMRVAVWKPSATFCQASVRPRKPIRRPGRLKITLCGMNSPTAPQALLVVAPNWVGDVVMATPTLAALRAGLPHTRISVLLRPHLADLLAGAEWCDETISWPTHRGLRREAALLRLARRIRERRFDAALLLTNSFRSAALVRLARIPRRIGYARDGRGWLLTDAVQPSRTNGRFTPVSMVDFYARLSRRLGVTVTQRRLRLCVTDAERREASRVLRAHGVDPGERYAVLCPGAAFGAAKSWPAERFAVLSERLAAEYSLRVVIAGAPAEAELMRRISSAAQSPVEVLLDPGTTLGSLKAVIDGAAVAVCNDSGPRHIANALDVPTVALFGPTDPAWAVYDAPREVLLRELVECGPCQLRVCPLDHRCMTRITVERVVEAIEKLAAVAHDSHACRTEAADAHIRRRETAGGGEGDAA